MSEQITDPKEQRKAAFFAEVDAKVAELKAAHNCDIYAIVYVIPGEGDADDELIAGYLKKPSVVAQMKIIDAAYSSPTSAGEMALRTGIIQEASNSNILNETKNPRYDTVFLGACQDALAIIKTARNQYKKK